MEERHGNSPAYIKKPTPATHECHNTNYVRKNVVIGAACLSSSSSPYIIMVTVDVVVVTTVGIVVVIHAVNIIIDIIMGTPYHLIALNSEGR